MLDMIYTIGVVCKYHGINMAITQYLGRTIANKIANVLAMFSQS